MKCIHVEIKNLPPWVQGVFQTLGKRPDSVAVIPGTKAACGRVSSKGCRVTLYASARGTKVDKVIQSSWGGPNIGVSRETAQGHVDHGFDSILRLPGQGILEVTEGAYFGARLFLHPQDPILADYLPEANPGGGLSPRAKAVLVASSCYKASYRREALQRAGLLPGWDPQDPRAKKLYATAQEELKALGLVNGRGAITPKGRNTAAALGRDHEVFPAALEALKRAALGEGG